MKKIYKITKETQNNVKIDFIELNKNEYELVSSIIEKFNMEEAKMTIEESKFYFRVSICRHSDCEFCPEQLIREQSVIPVSKIVNTVFNNRKILSYKEGISEYALFTSVDKAVEFRNKYLRNKLSK